MKKLIALLLCMMLACASVSALAVSITDAHGNVIELDDTLEAYAEVALYGADNAARADETNLGDLWTDALLWFAQSGKINEYYDEDDVLNGSNAIKAEAAGIVAVWNGGNLRADVAVGKFGAEQLAQVLPYPNRVAVIYMTGAQLVEALEAASQGLPCTEATLDQCAAFMQIAGANYTVDTTIAYDAGEVYNDKWAKANSLGRVTITEVNGKEFDAAAVYAVITSNANFNGMDSSYMFAAAAAADDASAITTAVVRDVVWMYISEALNNVISADYEAAQGRISIIR